MRYAAIAAAVAAIGYLALRPAEFPAPANGAASLTLRLDHELRLGHRP